MHALAAVVVLTACTGDGVEFADPVDVTAADPSSSTTTPVGEDAAAATSRSVVPTSAAPARSPVPSDAAVIVEVPETGVPGLDSDDRFCAAWSRFGGSWQILLVGSTFLGDAVRVTEWEIAAAHVIETAYADLLEHFPEELASERSTVADAYFGALQRRAATADSSLAAAGSDPEAVQRLGQAWLDALAERDPFDPDLVFEIPDDLRGLVGRAVDDFRSRRVDFHLDPSMVIGAETPLTDAYLETGCPDQGTLTGQEVSGG